MARMSTATAAKIRAELDELRGPGREAAAEALVIARAAGKIDENTDYWLADEERNRLEARIAQLQATLADAEITDEQVAVDSVVVEGCVVELRFDGDEETERFYFGGAVGAPDGLDAVTPGSPLGKALDGAHVGDTVSYQTPTRVTLSVEVVALSAA